MGEIAVPVMVPIARATRSPRSKGESLRLFGRATDCAALALEGATLRTIANAQMRTWRWRRSGIGLTYFSFFAAL
jgi:hypothetical protein